MARDIYLTKKLPKLHDIFFRKFLYLFVFMFFTLCFVFYFWMKSIYIEQIKISLLHNIDIVQLQITQLDDTNNITRDIKASTGIRVTIISNTGIVIGESDKDFDKMDNHINRIEIVQAKNESYGYAMRYSKTLKKELLYVCRQFSTKQDSYYIRMARDIEFIDEEFFGIALKITILLFAFLLFAFFISLNISKDVQTQTENILSFLRNLTKQNRQANISSDYSIEFIQITKLLSKVSKSLSKTNKRKSKYTTKLKLSNRQKDDIISAISHEFKNPIAVINGYTQTLLEDELINKTIRKKFLQKIQSNAMRLADMVDRLRLSVKLEDGKQSLNIENTNINQCIEQTVEVLRHIYIDADIKIIGTDIYLDIDKMLINIVIGNLLENALKYSQDTVTITLDKYSLSIEDSGIGISQENITKIISKFFRVSTNTHDNSLGIGLFLVKNILELHKFKLLITSEENRGTKFQILFK